MLKKIEINRYKWRWGYCMVKFLVLTIDRTIVSTILVK